MSSMDHDRGGHFLIQDGRYCEPNCNCQTQYHPITGLASIIDHLYYLVWHTMLCKVSILKDYGGHFEIQNGGIKLHDPDCYHINML